MTTPDDFYQTTRGQRALQNLGAISANDALQAAVARVPQFADVRKTEYLVLRSVHFSHAEALAVTMVDAGVYDKWLSQDSDFRTWAGGKNFRDLQTRVANDILRSRFLRNVFLQLHIDEDLLQKRAFDPENMTSEERKEAFEASKRYSAPNIAAMLRVLDNDDSDGDDSKAKKVFQLTVETNGGKPTTEDYRATARMLLDSFTLKESEDFIDGEVLNWQ